VFSSGSAITDQVANNLLGSTHLNDEPTGLKRSLRSMRSITEGDGADRLRMVAYAPAFLIIATVLAIELGFGGFRSTAGSWLPLVEVFAILASVLAGTLWFGWGQARVASKAMTVLNAAEDERRTISAIGIGANWDLDINRIFARFSNDLTTLIDFDRLTITTARRDGRMQLEFVSGMQAPEDEIGGLVLSVVGSPDGLVNPRDYGLNSQMTVPISAIDGTITIRSRDHDAYGPRHVDIMRQVVAQISPGISNAIHYQESQHRVMERTALAEIGRAATHETDLDSILLVVSGALSNLMKFDHLGTVLTEPQEKKAAVVCWSTPGLLGLNVGDLVNIDGAQSGSGILSGRGRDPLGFSTNGGASETEDRLWMQVPLGEQSNLLGMLVVSAHIDAVLGDDEVDLLQRVANQISPAIQNARLTADLTRTLEERRVVANIGRAASSKTDIRSIFALFAKELEHILPFDRFVASAAVPETESVEVSYVTGEAFEGRQEGDRIAKPNSDENRELRAKRAIVRNSKESFGDNDDQNHLKHKYESWVKVALSDISDPMGYLSFRSELTDAYTPIHVDFLEDIARQMSPTLKNAQMFEMERALLEQLDSQNKELQEANAVKTRFLSTVSHELKTPLTIVSGFIDLMADDADDLKEEHVEALEIMQNNSYRLGLLINDVLDISRMDAGKLRIEPTTSSRTI